MGRAIFEFKEEDHDVILHVRTKSPTKWVLVDRETGQSYQGNVNGFWDRLETVTKVDRE